MKQIGKWTVGFASLRDKCGLLSVWIDDFVSWSMSIHLFVKKDCWTWGFVHDEILPEHYCLGLGPLFLATWGNT